MTRPTFRDPGDDYDEEEDLVPLGEALEAIATTEKASEIDLAAELPKQPRRAVGGAGFPLATQRMENQLLARALFDADPPILEWVDAGLSPRSFTQKPAGLVFAAILDIIGRKEAVSRASILDELLTSRNLAAAGGEDYLDRLELELDESAHPSVLARLLVKHGVRRQAFEAAQRAQADLADGVATEEVLDALQADASRLLSGRGLGGGTTADLSVVARTVLSRLPIIGGKRNVLPSRFLDFDGLVGGFTPGELILVAARPSMGKTALALSLLHRLAVRQRVPSAFFSLEMGADQLVERLVAIGSGVPLRKARATPSEHSHIVGAAGDIAGAPLFIDDASALTIGEMRSRARRLVTKNGCQIVFVDYLQLLHGSGKNKEGNRTQEIGEVSRGLKALARELLVPVIALAQLSRQVEGRAEKRPVLSDLRESGDLEQDADIVSFLFRDGYYRRGGGPDESEAAEWIVAKNRNGPTGTVPLAYRAALPAYADLAKDHR
jgi:replicative DNA helicase